MKTPMERHGAENDECETKDLTAQNSPQIQPPNKRRYINFRSFLVIAIVLSCGVFAALVTTNIPALGIIIFASLLIATCFFAYIYRSTKFKMVTFIVAAIAVSISFSSFIAINSTWTNKDLNRTEVFLTAMVEQDFTRDGTRRVYLSNASIDGVSINGRVLLFVFDDDFVMEAGIVISQLVTISATPLVENFSVDGWAFRNNIRFRANTQSIDQTTIQSTKAPFFVRLRQTIAQALIDAMGQHRGGLAYGMVVGDSAYIESGVRGYFSAAGLSHILAVSGLHLNVAIMLLAFILSKLKAPRTAIAAVTVSFIVFYLFLASFSPSVLRASIMSLVAVYIFLSGHRRDNLSTLAFAFCLIITFAPFFLFEVGFIYSFSAVLGIFIFFKPISSSLQKFKIKKFKIPKKIVDAIALTTSIQIGFLPISLFTFNTLAVYSRLVNLFLMPVIMVVFLLILVFLVFALITTVNFPLYLSGYGIGFLDTIAAWVASLPFSTIIIYSTPLIFLVYGLYFLGSRYVMFDKKRVVSFLCAVLACFFLFVQFPSSVSNGSIVPIYFSFSNVTLVVGEDGSKNLVGDFGFGGSILRDELQGLGLKNIDNVFVSEINQRTARNLLVLYRFFGDFVVFYPQCQADSDDDWEGLIDRWGIKRVSLEGGGMIDGGGGFGVVLCEDDKFLAYEFLFEVSGNGVRVEAVSNNIEAVSGKMGVGIGQAEGVKEGKLRTAVSSNIIRTVFVPSRNERVIDTTPFDIIRSNRHFGQVEQGQILLINGGNWGGSNVVSFDKQENYAFNFLSATIFTATRRNYGLN
ncbi:MAG: ComEC/Rec2 family competence protein [Firmicutes bacterium]|nr:ComEC/Rec2 family competence protein [Bacillota bacterium]